jgi:hypothetical protein
MHAMARTRALKVGPPEDVPPRFMAKASLGGGGLGWGHSISCESEAFVGHDGWVDRHVANVGFFPGEGVGVVVLANKGPADSGWVLREVNKILHRSGGMQARTRIARRAPALEGAADAVAAQISAWDPAAYRAMLSPGHLATVPIESEQAELDGYRALHGRCTRGAIARFDSELRGRVALSCERGRIEVELILDKKSGKLAGFMGFSSEVPASDEGRRAAELAVRLLARWDEAAYEAGFVPTFMPPADMRKALADHRKQWGKCSLGKPTERDGQRWQRFELACERGAHVLSMRVSKDDASKIDGFLMAPKVQGACAPAVP